MAGRILIADTTATDRIILTAKLEAARYEILEARSCDEVLARARRDHPRPGPAALPGAAGAGRYYQRLVFIGHGGWDGPVIGSRAEWATRQVSGKENPELFDTFVAAIQKGMTPDGKILASSCHAGGSDRYERAMRATLEKVLPFSPFVEPGEGDLETNITVVLDTEELQNVVESLHAEMGHDALP